MVSLYWSMKVEEVEFRRFVLFIVCIKKKLFVWQLGQSRVGRYTGSYRIPVFMNSSYTAIPVKSLNYDRNVRGGVDVFQRGPFSPLLTKQVC